jgi:hypothetical protein
MSRYIAVAALLAAAWGFVATGETKANTAATYLALAQQYEQSAAYYQRFGGAYATTAKYYRDLAARFRQLAAQMGGGGGGGSSGGGLTVTPSTGLTPQQIARKAADSRSRWLSALASARRFRVYYIYYSRPPIYQGESNYTRAARPMVVNGYDAAVREVTRLTNNWNVIDNIQVSN